jgi:hypothetical protein
VIDEPRVIVKLVEEPDPVGGTEPVPVQPVQVQTILPTVTGEVTNSVMPEPESNQPLTGVGESYWEVTVR